MVWKIRKKDQEFGFVMDEKVHFSFYWSYGVKDTFNFSEDRELAAEEFFSPVPIK